MSSGLAIGAAAALAVAGSLLGGGRGSRSISPGDLPPQVPSPHRARMAFLLSLKPKIEPIESAPLAYRAFRSYVEENNPWGDYDGWVIWGEIPAEEAKRMAWESLDEKSRWPGFDEYHAWYVSGPDVPNYGPLNRWPSLVNLDEGEELFWDGWHRFHSYIRSGHATVPFYAVISPQIGKLLRESGFSQ